ncbi:MAG: trypsin-like peptidase domain-containing protein [Microbacteriaceae bacterium]|nr:trypsin-like peptidase domain-containing protein [Microbacteriaceae bacterium]
MGANQNDSVGGSSSVPGPANITVNDPSNATTITAVAASAGPSVVTISVSDANSSSAGTGSGVVLSKDGYILTNTHVVTLDGASAKPVVSVQTSDGHLYSAKVIGTDPISDLAVIKVQSTASFQPASFADSSKLNVGDIAVAIGAPLGLSNTVTNGIVSSLNRSITVASSAVPTTPEDSAPKSQDSPFDFWQFNTPNQAPTAAASTISLSVIQTDAAINPGNSGGALLNSNGKVIGINVAIASAGAGSSGGGQSGSIGVGFAIPSNFAKRIADEIIATGKGTHGLLGASVSDVTSATATVVGANIEKVTAGGAASASGLAAGDIITAVGGIPVASKTDLTAQIRALAAGSKTTLTYVRGGASRTVDITLGSLS